MWTNFSSEFKLASVHKSYFPSVPVVPIASMIAAWLMVLMWITAPSALIISVSSKLPGQTEGIWKQRDTHLESHLRLPTQPLKGLGAVSLQVVLLKKKKNGQKWVRGGEARGRTKGGERKTNHLSWAIWWLRAGGSCSADASWYDKVLDSSRRQKNGICWELWGDEYFLLFSNTYTHTHIYIRTHTLSPLLGKKEVTESRWPSIPPLRSPPPICPDGPRRCQSMMNCGTLAT